ncbi:MAG: 7-cyano-7-deazaguanine synthase [Geobacter sp.]|nr:7-cyano-7-deazaguanine synthase [Geobacter sp.]
MRTAILLSGGIDSISLAVWKRPEVAITVNYGQLSAQSEMDVSRHIASLLKIEHHVINVDCRDLGNGDLAGKASLELSPSPEWWPFRNQMLVTFAAMKAIQLGIRELFLGCVKNDGFHIDGTESFVTKLNDVLSMQEGGIGLSAPAIGMTTVELARASGVTPEILSWAHSCHVSNTACGNCRGCYKHQSVMQELGYGFY